MRMLRWLSFALATATVSAYAAEPCCIIYGDVQIGLDGYTLYSKGRVEAHLQCIGNRCELTVGKHWITGSDFRIVANKEYTDPDPNVYETVWDSRIIASGTAGLCYRASIEAYSGKYYNGFGSSQYCLPKQVADCRDPLADGSCPPTGSECTEYDETCKLSPIVINVARGAYALTGIDDPVLFDLDADGHPESTGWTARNGTTAFLALDRNGNATIDDGSELFGDATPTFAGKASNGFEGLLQYDDNADGTIDRGDGIWAKLLLWSDRNHDGHSEARELTPIAASPITALGLDYHWTGRRDASGNTFRYKGQVRTALGTQPYYDVFFLVRR